MGKGTMIFAGILTAVLLVGMFSIPATASEVAQTSLVADAGEDLTVNEGEIVYFNGSGSGGSSTTTYWDDLPFGCDSWITAAPSDATLAEFSYSSTTYPALVALEYGMGRSVYAEGSTFSETKDSPDFVRYQLFINSVRWATRDKVPSQTNILATWGHRELLTYHDGSNIVTMLENQGYNVDVSFDVPTSLAGYDAVVMPGIGWEYYYGGWVDPNLWSGYGGANPNGHAPTATEVSTLLTFIQNGGGFVASIEEDDGANWLSGVGNPMNVSFAFISPAIPLTGYRLVDHPIFYKWNDSNDTGIVSYEWDFDVSIDSDGDGDPTNDVDAMGATPTHLYDGDDGVYTVTLTVTDTDDLTAMDTMTVTVNNVASTVSISASPGTIGEGGSVTLTGYFDDPGWLDTHLAIWDFGDGATEVGSFTPGIGFTHHDMTPMTHTYGDDGIYTVTLTVTDDDGAIGTDTCIVTVLTDNQPPIADASPDQTADVGETVYFDGSGSYDPDGTIVNYEWDFGDGTSYTSTSTEVVDIEQITDAPYRVSDPNWSPDSQKIAVCEVDFGRYADVVVMNSDGTGQQHLTSTSTLHERFPSFSPDGTKIAYVKGTVDTLWGDYDIWIMDVDGTNRVQLTTDPACDRTPTWSPDGSKMFFESTRGGSVELWVMANDGSNLVKLTDGISRACHPDVSPDGKKVVFSSDASGTHEIVTLDLDTNTTQTLTSDSTVHNYYPSWSPDGRYIQFTKASLDHQASNLWIMSADGGNPTQITFDTGRNELADWSPDGQMIAYRSTRNGTCNIFLATLGCDPYASHIYTQPGIYSVTLTVTDDDGATGMDTCTITVIVPATGAALSIIKEKINGPDVVETHTCCGWTLEITVTNLGGSDATDVFVYDVLPAELALIDHTLTQGTFTYAQNGCGQAGSTSLTWDVGSIGPGDSASLTLVISTTTNPAGQQEFTSPGNYSLNDGAWVVGTDSLTGEDIAAGPTPPITVVAVDPEEGNEDEEDENDDDEGNEDPPEEADADDNEAISSPAIESSPSDPTESENGAIEYMENKAKQPNRWFGTYTQILLLFAVVVIGIALEIAKLRTEKQRDKIIEELDRKLIKGEMSEESYLKEVEKINN